MRAAIFEGRLSGGFRLPGSRQLAESLGISRNSVVAVYDLLLSEGYVQARPGGGTFVAHIGRVRHGSVAKPRRSAQRSTDAEAALTGRMAPYWRTTPAVMRAQPASSYSFDFLAGCPDRECFPHDVWRRLAGRALRASSKAPALYGEIEGRAQLRDAVTKHVAFIRAIACSAQDVVVTNGAQQAFDLIARLFVEPGRTVVAVESPGYAPMRWAFEAAGAQIASVRVDEEGLVVEELPRSTRVICVSPSHQFPMGVAMSARRRAQLLDFAGHHRAVIVEDDYDGEFAGAAGPIDALKTLDDAGQVFYVGTFSKCLFPALRLGYIVAPPWALGALAAAKQRTDWHANALGQDTLAAFMLEGHLARHLRKIRALYSERRRILEAAIRRFASDRLRIVSAPGGLHVTALTTGPRRSDRAALGAAEERVRVLPISRYSADPKAPDGFVFGVGLIAANRVDTGLARLVRHLG
jgi:GntR family transcriptional regulator/MocR family aminotransferase